MIVDAMTRAPETIVRDAIERWVGSGCNLLPAREPPFDVEDGGVAFDHEVLFDLGAEARGDRARIPVLAAPCGRSLAELFEAMAPTHAGRGACDDASTMDDETPQPAALTKPLTP